mmetsp:Transcript_34440/g.81575  ORF Transcript_34440/g.81575 Transcript_34440/m.81575 type:complete len:140 (-) Transcript_34440:130-549(-)
MVSVSYGSAPVAEEKRSSATTTRQIAVALAIIACAVVVAVALVASSDMQGKRVALYGLGSGEEQDGANGVATAFGTFDGQDELMEEELGPEYFKEVFNNTSAEESTEEQVEEVEVAIGEAKNEHDMMQVFYDGADAPLE